MSDPEADCVDYFDYVLAGNSSYAGSRPICSFVAGVIYLTMVC